jgi:cyclophilin family peptidyl-prolyl cis-trans isomerase/HEAT repeat protein
MTTALTPPLRLIITRALAAGLLASAGCASAPPAPQAAVVPIERKMASILQLEDQRILRAEPPAAPAPPPVQGRRGRVAVAPPTAPPPDLTALVIDPEARVRRRAAIAIGRTGLKEGVPALSGALKDADVDVRAMAAFALGLIGDPSATQVLVTALADPDPAVRGRAAEALGQIGAKEAAERIGQMAAEYARTPAVAAMKPDDEPWPAASKEAEAFRLGVLALVRLRAYEPLAAAVLDPSGRPVTEWWPVAFALQRIADTRGQPALTQLVRTPGKYTRAFAARGLGALKDASAVELLLPLLDPAKTPREVVASSIRAVGQIGDQRAVPPLVALVSDPANDSNLRLDAVAALGALRARDALALIQDLMTDDWPSMRIGAIRAAGAIDPESLVLVLSSLDPDPHWLVRAALADVLGSMPAEAAEPRLREMLKDVDKRVLPPVLRSLVRLRVADAAAIVLAHLKEPDFAVRATAASLLGQLKPAEGAAALREAYTAALPDSAYDARVAALTALAEYGPAEAAATLKTALTDKDWAVRLRARALLEETIEPSSDYRMAIRPAPAAARYDDPQLVTPPFSPHVFIETAKGTIEIELAVLDAPLTSMNFMTLVRKGFFNGLQVHRVVTNFVVQDGDPRGDGEGGPGYTIRDELNDRPFVRGVVGMALAGPDTGGSQFFITHSPQPHLDADYTVFGHVVSGMDVVDRIRQGDVIQQMRVWDGKSW